MFPRTHIILGFFFALIVFLISPPIGIFNAIIIFLSSFLIDVDHYLFYVFTKKDFSLRKAYNFFIYNRKKFLALAIKEKEKYCPAWFFLHGIEPLILLFLMSFLWEPFLFILIGFAFHLMLDYAEQWAYSKRKDKISVIWDFLKFKKLKNNQF